jgi:hypothetical protein
MYIHGETTIQTSPIETAKHHPIIEHYRWERSCRTNQPDISFEEVKGTESELLGALCG